MEKRKRWQFALIVGVLVLTIYNILPTIFFYAKPLDAPVTAKTAHHVADGIAGRVNALEGDSVSWVKAFAKNLGLKAQSVHLVDGDPRLIQAEFKDEAQATLFKQYLPRGGALIPFVPSQLTLGTSLPGANPRSVVVERHLSTHFDKDNIASFFTFSEMRDSDGKVTPEYRTIVYDRFARLGAAAGGVSESARVVLAAQGSNLDDSIMLSLAQEIVDYEKAFGLNSPITKRFYASFTQIDQGNKATLVQGFAAKLEGMRSNLEREIADLRGESGSDLLELAAEQKRAALDRQERILDSALSIVRGHGALFRAGQAPLGEEAIIAQLQKEYAAAPAAEQTVALNGRNPLVESVAIDWENDTFELNFYPEVNRLRNAVGGTEEKTYVANKLNQFIVNEVAYLSRVSDEKIAPGPDGYNVAINQLPGSSSFLALNLDAVAEQQVEHTLQGIDRNWQPTHADLVRQNFPLNSWDDYKKLSAQEQELGLVVYAPGTESKTPPAGLRTNSIYVIARGLAHLDQKSEAGDPALVEDFTSLAMLLRQNGFVGYPASAFGLADEFKNDYIFELDDYYANLLTATRENFTVHGSKRQAVLEFTDNKQRLLALNEIDSKMHEDLLRWQDQYQAAQVALDANQKHFIPAPTKSVLVDNLHLSTAKYFRGDERKVLKWGLDLSGGKSVTIGLRDRNGQPVTNPADLEEGANQLYTRVNKMGVSEVEIRTEGNNITLNFPGAQGLSASELVKGSTMFFHIMNEKFTANNPNLRDAVARFSQEVWNEAIVTNRKDIENINEIAWQHLGGDLDNDGVIRPRSEAAQVLYNNGLRIANPNTHLLSNNFDDTFSSIAMMRGENFSEWGNQTTPLMVVFANYGLDGSSLENIHAQYDTSEGNSLSFSVARATVGSDGIRTNPQADFYAWTSHFAKSKVAGTPLELYSRGEGWRMAAILNGQIISAPQLLEPLKDHARVTGQFSQRDVNQLVADLKAGSLTFTPKILSERNVSPELGHVERVKGISAALVGLVAVVVLMTACYRFAGLVASFAILFNLLIMWGVLQNLDAALTLPGIAGIILTMGMAVDANVLVFERIREEFALSGRLGNAVHAGYKKAFTAIFDSNLTTIMAALILLNFDAGPIKGFAVTLIVGIVSSMFTSLFMTRFFFSGWVQNPKHKKMKMARLFQKTNFNFVAKAKVAVTASLLVIVAGGGLLFMQRHTIFGMDFTGGYALNVAIEEKDGVNYRNAVTEALVLAGASTQDLQVRELNRPNQLRIQLGMGLEQAGGPFHNLAEESLREDYSYSYQNNPRISWVVSALGAQGLDLQPATLGNLENQWNVMSGQFSSTMRNSAIYGLGLALLCILIYLTFRFEFKFAISAIVALAHDLLISVGALAMLRWVGVPVQIDLQVVGALMTIIGYSLNDTIIVFDRIREDGRVLRKLSFPELINHALNATLNRTLMTSGTTLVVLLSLVALGGAAIFDFALVMTMGVVFGTFSSLFIASPVLLFFHNREGGRQTSANALRKA